MRGRLGEVSYLSRRGTPSTIGRPVARRSRHDSSASGDGTGGVGFRPVRARIRPAWLRQDVRAGGKTATDVTAPYQVLPVMQGSRRPFGGSARRNRTVLKWPAREALQIAAHFAAVKARYSAMNTALPAWV